MPYKKKNIENNTENIEVDNTASEVKNDTESNVNDNVKTVEKIVERIIEKPVKEDNRLDKKINVRSIAPWITGAPRVTTNGDISVPPKGTVLLSREEVIAQAQNGNRLINGTDSVGSHATWYIDDAFTRSELSFDIPDENKSQTFLTKDIVEDIFDIKSQKDFETEIENRVVTRAEKAYLIECIKEFNFNDYRKIDFCVKYTGIEP
ncbi:hypothetical protein [Coprococcus sp. RTP21281st1_F1_RTP21281_210402]|uniref:hypothetical protein n=1 Tax=Coprococcus sp. RTP21281st1_F1_RTP21281_210402 TaxID=3143208 RepID=UPI0034A19B3C